MNNALMVIGALLIAALAALFAVPYFIDWNGYRGVFEEEASRVLGRDVRVGGAVNLRFLPSPYVRFERIRIADPTGMTGEPLFRAENFTMWLSVPPLLKGVLEARQVELKKPVLSLAVDAAGSGNWSSLKLTTGSLPFVPANVTLQAMRISEGAISVQRANGEALAEVTDIEGDLESDALLGPYRFKGIAGWQGGAREIRLATAAPDADGSLRFKTIVRAPATSNTYTLEGRVFDLKERPRIEGEVSAKVGIEVGGAVQKTDKGSKVKAEERPAIDFKARLVADGTGARLDEINGTLENVGQPQLVAGRGELAWVKGLRASAALSSRWLDLDKLVGTGIGGAPVQTAMALADALMHVLPVEAASTVKLAVDQVNLGGDAVAGLRLSVSRAEGPLKLDSLEASLPGGARLDLAGTISGTSERRFTGTVGLHGPSFGRFIGWATGDSGLAASRGDGPFVVHGGLGFSRKGVELTEATTEVAGSTVRGEVRWARGEPDLLRIALSGHRLDLRALWPLAGRHSALVGLGLSPGEAATPLRSSDLDLHIRAGELIAGDQAWRDVDARVSLSGGKLSLGKLSAGLADGSSVDVEGEINEPARRARGRLTWQLSAYSADALTRIARAAAPLLPGAETVPAPAATLFPLRLAGSLSLGERGERALDVTFDGSAEPNGGRVAGGIRLDGGLGQWREQPLDFRLTAETSDGLAIASLMGFGERPVATERKQAIGGRLLIRAGGIPASGLTALASLDGTALSASYEGQVILADGARRLDGQATLAARDARELLALVGVGLADARAGTPIQGSLSIKSEGDGLKLVPRGLLVGGSAVDGALSLATPQGKPMRMVADLRSGNASLEGLLGAVLDDRAPGAGGSSGGVWPELAFDMTPLDRVEGEIKLHLGSLTAAPGMTLRDASMTVQLQPGRVTVSELSGQAAGGSARARLTLQKQAAGVSFTGEVSLTGVELARLASQGARHRASGSLGLRLSGEGRALSPAGLVASLAGKGKVELGRDAGLAGYAPDALASAVESVVAGKNDVQGDALMRLITDALAGGRLALGPRTLDLEIAGGAVKVPAITVETSHGRTTLITTVELSSLKVDGELRVEAKAMRKRGDGTESALLPPVSAIYVGALGEIGAAEPRVSVGTLERELAVRRMERSVEELERLRKQDEERARQEQERQREAAEKAKAEAAARQAVQQQQQAPAADRPWLTSPPVPAPAPETPAPERPWLTNPPVPAQEQSGMVPMRGGQPVGVEPGPGPTPPPSGAPSSASGPRSGLSQADPPRPSPARKVSPSDLIMRQFQGTPN